MFPVVHFEIPYKNSERITKFYSSVFGWKMTVMEPDSNNYILVTTAEYDAKPGFPAGAINGGFYAVQPEWLPHHPSIVIAVDDVQTTKNDIIQYGGKIIGDPVTIPNYGIYLSFIDTEGNRNSIIQPSGM